MNNVGIPRLVQACAVLCKHGEKNNASFVGQAASFVGTGPGRFRRLTLDLEASADEAVWTLHSVTHTAQHMAFVATQGRCEDQFTCVFSGDKCPGCPSLHKEKAILCRAPTFVAGTKREPSVGSACQINKYIESVPRVAWQPGTVRDQRKTRILLRFARFPEVFIIPVGQFFFPVGSKESGGARSFFNSRRLGPRCGISQYVAWKSERKSFLRRSRTPAVF